ncbi:RNA polymerase sigma factor [Halalkalibaculum sp. DA3122]|uniref:RNA polymerase sigma factor n=1 Tax=unclassified Halalkalibaculum TaxID=2964617 RepID=UPI0037542C14
MSDKKIHSVRKVTPDENNLWELFLNGNLDAWEQIFTLYYEDLYGYGLKLSGRPELTKDCIHELFVVLWDRREHLSEVDSTKAYLLASLRRSLLKKIKKRRKYFEEQEEPLESIPKIQFSPEVILIKDEVKAEKLKALYKALDDLPSRQKEVLYLKYFNGMSYDEIEDILSIKYQSIKNHIYRAISNLREIMGDDITKIAISLLPLLLFV